MNRRLSASRRAWDLAMRFFLYLCALATCALLIFLIGYICLEGVPGISLTFLTTASSVLRGTVGILPAIQNTLYVILVSLIIALPLGVGAAIYLTEYARSRKLVEIIEFVTETLAGIPSIIYALVGNVIFCVSLHLGKTLIAGALTLVIMVLPTIIRTTQESLKTVPASYREGSLGLGSGKWHMIRTVVLPSSIDGIVTGCILAVGRIVGESAVLMFTAGMETDRVFLEPVDPNTMVWESPVSKYTLPSNTPSGNPPADIGSLKSRGALSNPLRNSSFEDHLAESS